MSTPDSPPIQPVAERLQAQAVDQIDRLGPISSGPRLIAIDGRSGTGKSTLAVQLARHLGATLVSGDDFFAGGTAVLDLDDASLADICIDRARLRDVLGTLKSGWTATYKPFDWDAFDGSLAPVQTRLLPGPFLIVEGAYSTHPDLRPLIDIAVLVDLPAADRESRLIAREGHLGPWERQWHRAEDWYFNQLVPRENFDVRIVNV
ncbi:MAG: hypothetical protein AAGK37_12315 [Pseudomonadota bacterium]